MLLLSAHALAAEGGKGVYLLGKRGPLAAFIPKPGLYVSNDLYYYGATGSDFLPTGGRIAQDVDAAAWVDIPQFTWVTDLSIGGGRLALSLVTPFGTVDVDAHGAVELPNGTEIARGVSDSDSGFGDPSIAGSLGWKRRTGDRFRAWSVYSALSIPIGSYEVGRIANLSANRWAVDVGGAYTMANFKGGRELSAVLGVTFNDENHDTGYDTGTEVHFELAGKQHLPSGWSGGFVAYYYKQVTGDSGAPAVLGDFKGEVFGFGPELSYQIRGEMPVTVDVRWYHEFASENRLEGDAVFLTVSVPLRVRPTREAAQDWSSEAQE